MKCSVSFYDHSSSVGAHLFTFFLFTLLHRSTNSNQSAPNLIKMYVTIRFRMSSIMDVIGPGTVRVICPWIRKIAIFDIVYTLAFAIVDKSAPNLVTVYMIIREIRKIAEFDFIYTIASANINQSAPNLVKMYLAKRSQMSVIMDLIRLQLFELSALELEKLPYWTLFTL